MAMIRRQSNGTREGGIELEQQICCKDDGLLFANKVPFSVDRN